ncbi:MAG: hypothetical protein IKJ10_05560 [Bacteroidaceae bacterium]|nr:hypothetical protein [Bacteroidaceae bacterium]
MDINKELLLLFDDPLFVNVKVPAKPLTADDRMVEKLLAINAFVRENDRKPSTTGNFEEKKLARSLKALRESGNESLKDWDEFGLL